MESVSGDIKASDGDSEQFHVNLERDYKSNCETPLKSTSGLVVPELNLDEDETPIDDDEFHIPAVDFEPTLESILNDVDNVSASDDEGLSAIPEQSPSIRNFSHVPEGSDTVSIISKESSDNRSRSSNRSQRPKNNFNNSSKKPNSILRHVLLKGITSQINSAADKINAGSSTAVVIGSLVAVGTSHGYVLVFDALQVMKWCLGDISHREEGGSVSSLAVSSNGTRLLVGYAKGLILMYDLDNGKLLRTLHDAHATGTAVLVLRFTDYPILALCSDSGGSVFELNFKRTMGVRGCDSRCIFSGSRGEVCTFEPLMLASYSDNPLTRYVIVALATLSKVIVVMIRPKLKVLFTHALVCNPTTLPLLAWQMVIIQTTRNEKIIDPVLTFARENTVYFYQVTLDTRNTIQFLPLQKISLNYTIISLHWLNSRTLAIVDVRERLRVVDVRSQEELESVDLLQCRLVYASSHFKGLATGGNVSKAFAISGERACYNSILCFCNQIIVLGTKSVHALTMRSWHERLDYLVKQLHFPEALQLGYELYLEKAKAVVGLKGSKDSKRMVVREKLLCILDRYVEKLHAFNYMEDLNSAKQNYEKAITDCIQYYVLLDHKSPIYSRLYDTCLVNPVSKSAYLQCLEPFILNDQLRPMPPIIVKDFISHYEEVGNLKPLEACIVHLNVESLDIHQTMKLCWTQGLYDAIIYIYNQGMIDYITPLEELMTELQSAISTGMQLSDTQVALGNKILVYTSCCLAGRAYPYGNIPPNLVEKVQSDVFQVITTLHTRNSSENEQSYPYLKTFLKFDTREFLNVLSLSFEEPVFQTELGRRQKQRLVDILLQVMVEQGDFTPTQVGVLFTFLARQMAKPENSLYVSKHLFEQVLEHLTSAKETVRLEERQQALLELLQAGGMQHFDPEKLLEKCLEAKFFRVCEMLYERKQDYERIIECYLYDEARSHQVFSFLHKIFCIKPTKRDEICAKVKHHLKELVLIDNKKTARAVYLHMSTLITDFVKSLESEPNILYRFLQGIFHLRDQNQSNIQVDMITTEKYIDLMCQFEPGSVFLFLKSVESYRPEHAYVLCEKYKINEAMGYLLEKTGKYQEAFEVMYAKLKWILEEMFNGAEGGCKDNSSVIDKCEEFRNLFLIMVPFAQRHSPKMSKEGREKLWLPLFELTIGAHSRSKADSQVASTFAELTKYVLGSMMGHVSLPTIVEIIMKDPAYSKATFTEIKDLVSGMLETCTYEQFMVNLVKRITESDVHERLATKLKCTKKGFAPRNKTCPACQANFSTEQYLSAEDSQVLVFHCGHSFHHDCCSDEALKVCSLCQVQGKSEGTSENNVISFPVSQHQTSSFWNTNGGLDKDHVISHAEFELKLEAPTKVYNIKGGF
ncbi:unnamed protein product [Allacma fusca]|uniref:RING-type domain-containing protein n=1 Tax=Allacma fusca TaxID=39272 RepID=A0A8J2KJK1_9HEXA|nr:unnamed protein product [Allacma fusca]